MLETKVIELHRTRDFGKKLNATVEFIKQNFKPLFKCILYICGPAAILGSLLVAQVFDNLIEIAIMAGSNIEPIFSDFVSFLGYGIFGVLLLLIATTLLVATIYDFMLIYEQKGSNEIEVSEVWAKVKRSFWKVLGNMILYFLMFLGVYLLMLIPLFIFSAISPVLGAIVAIFFVFGGLIYFFVSTSLVFVISSYEGVGFGTAVSRSFKLIKENWWATFGLVIVAGIIRSALSYIFLVPYYIFTFVGQYTNLEPNSLEEPSFIIRAAIYIFTVLYVLMSIISYCIPLIVIAFQYFNLVEKKEAKGLMNKIDDFGSSTITQQDEEEYY